MNETLLKKLEKGIDVVNRGETALFEYINEVDNQIVNLRKQIDSNFTDTNTFIDEKVGNVDTKIQEVSTSLFGEVRSLEDKLNLFNSVRPTNGVDGHTPTKDELISLIKPLIPKPRKGKDGVSPDPTEIALEASFLAYAELETLLPTLIPPVDPTEMRDKLESLKDDERIDAKSIKGLEEYATKSDLQKDIDKLAQRTQVLLQIATQRTNTTISTSTPSAGGVETPSGTVDGANTAFTVSNTPLYINVDGVNKYATIHYTYSAPTITITDGAPPVLFIRSHY